MNTIACEQGVFLVHATFKRRMSQSESSLCFVAVLVKLSFKLPVVQTLYLG